MAGAYDNARPGIHRARGPPKGTSTGSIPAASTRGVFKSSDGGGSWKLTGSLGLAATTISLLEGALALDPVKPETVYLGTLGRIFKSTDGGGSWHPASTGRIRRLREH